MKKIYGVIYGKYRTFEKGNLLEKTLVVSILFTVTLEWRWKNI